MEPGQVIELEVSQTVVNLEVNGAPGPPGPGQNGLSAYEVAVENGFEGTEVEWLESLKGDDGEPGPTGATGPQGATGPTGPAGTTNHSLLLNLNNDDHTQYLNLNGRAGGQTIADRLTFNAPALTGSAATSILNLIQTWNTTGNPTAIDLDITNIASGPTSNIIHLKENGNTRFRLRRNGDVVMGGSSDFGITASVGIYNRFGLSVGSTSNPVASAVLECTSTTRGFLPPRMTATQASAIASPAEGLMLYVTNTNGTFTVKGWWGWNGASWERLNN